MHLYIYICDNWIVYNNVDVAPKVIVKSSKLLVEIVINKDIRGIKIKQGNDNSK